MSNQIQRHLKGHSHDDETVRKSEAKAADIKDSFFSLDERERVVEVLWVADREPEQPMFPNFASGS